MTTKPNPDDRSNNVERLETAIRNTKENFEEAKETMQFSSADDQAAIQAKNERRLESITAMEAEVADEKQARKTGYQQENEFQ